MPKQTQTNKYLLLACSLAVCCLVEAANEQPAITRPWLRSRDRSNARQHPQPAPPLPGNGTAVELSAPAVSLSQANAPPASSATNRTVRTLDVFQNGDGYNIFVTNTCERDSMKVNIKTSRPFYGVIHTRSQRQKDVCTVEGNGGDDYKLEISHVLNSQDPAYCGVIRARRDSPQDKDVLSVVVVVRLHRNIELSDDKFFLLNCTNRCRKPDCSSPSAELRNPDSEREDGIGRTESPEVEAPNSIGRKPENGDQMDECTVWKFPWLITLLWCLGILCLAMMISHCIMCSSLICRCVRTEVEEREPSVYEGATDYEDDQYNKRHPFRIDYDNRDVYKTSNNYAPYTLEEAQTKSRKTTHKKGIS